MEARTLTWEAEVERKATKMPRDTWATDGNHWCPKGHGLQGQDEACVACEDGVPSIPRIRELEAEVALCRDRLEVDDHDGDYLLEEGVVGEGELERQVCPQCHETYRPTRRGVQVYCSPECRYAAAEERRAS